MLQDGLGSVRGVVDSSLNPLESRLYEPYGAPFGTSGTNQTSYGFTGEQTDGSGQVYLRARYYNPSMGVFTGLDPLEGKTLADPMSLNGYSWVEGNVPNAVDPTGECLQSDVCASITDMAIRVALGCNVVPPTVTQPTRTQCCDSHAQPTTVSTVPCQGGPPKIVNYDKICNQNDPTTNDACAVMAYRSLAQAYGQNGCLTWEKLLGTFFYTELGNIINPPANTVWYPTQEVVQSVAKEAAVRLFNQRSA